MRQVILHIGLHKTGTSSLQQFLCDNRDALAGQGWFYKAPWQGWPNQNPLVKGFQSPDTIEGGRRGIAMLMEEAGDRNILISSELLVEWPTDIDAFLACFEGCEFHAYAYLRHPCDIVISAYNEVIKSAGSTYSRPLNEAPYPYASDPTQLLRPWIGRVPLTLAPFDRAQWSGGAMSSDFLTMIGIDPASCREPERRSNESLPQLMVEVLRGANALGLAPEAREGFVAHLQGLDWPPSGYPLTAGTMEVLFSNMRRGVEVLRPFLRQGFDESFLFVPRP
ncbi:hypothetical protein GI374_03055 [Paracoccus sp. S-4012]|uniref:hypothetical protein n=1 Tax=Paracoccus sp. S-4012 TaxID=2665648 RepID=UPI0012AFFC32|nr:hypothetical protein [Paracoccus sp. S-4012]MRX49440.1 hypothetical protein [Paracoccus sp. S-4012]